MSRLWRGLQTRLLLVTVLLILLAMEVVSVFLLTSLSGYYIGTVRQNLATQGQLLGGFLGRNLASPHATNLSGLIGDFGTMTGVDTLVTDRYGRVVGSSGALGVGQTLSGVGVVRALEDTPNDHIAVDSAGTRELVVDEPVVYSGQVVGDVELRESLTSLTRALARFRGFLYAATGLALALSGTLAFIIARQITAPLRRITREATLLAGGQFGPALPVHGDDEISDLTRAFNEMNGRLEQAFSELGSEKDKLATILATMADGVVATAEDDTVLLANPAAHRLLQADRPLEGQHRGDVLPVAEADLANVRGRTLQLSSTALGARGGRVVLLHDVTREMELESTRRQFLADVSHELRTPLATIRSYLETVAASERIDAETLSRFVRVALSETDRLTRLVSDIMVLSRVESGHLTLDARPLLVGPLLQEVLDVIDPPAEAKGLHLAVYGDLTLTCLGDRDRMKQILLNLLTNAVKFSYEDGHLEVRVEADQEMVHFSVSDDGPGISAEHLPRLFERFYRVERARSRGQGGSGLGLAISRALAEAQGGTVWLESEEGTGTTAHVLIPRA